MLGSRISAFALICAAMATGSAPALATMECKPLRDFERDEGAGKRKYVDSFSFHKNGRGDSVLLLFKDTIQRGIPPKQWLFLHRPSPEMTDMCVMGRGEGFGQHDDKPEEIYAGKFDADESGHPRCATTNANMDARDALRASANRALGEGVIDLYTQGFTGPGFQFAIGSDRDWIIIQDNDDHPQTSCVFDEGTDVLMHYNAAIPVD